MPRYEGVTVRLSADEVQVGHRLVHQDAADGWIEVVDVEERAGGADVEPWMRGWISAHAGDVVEMIEGLRWFGPGAEHEFVIYARVAS